MHCIFGSVLSSVNSHSKLGPNMVASHLSCITFGETASVKTFTLNGLSNSQISLKTWFVHLTITFCSKTRANDKI